MAPMDHVYAVMDKNLYGPLEPMKRDRFRLDNKRNCTFHKDIGHTTDKYVSLKDEMKGCSEKAILRNSWMSLKQ